MQIEAPTKAGVALRAGLFILLGWLGMNVFPFLLAPVAGYLVTAALSSFASAAVANAIVVRIYERGRLSDLGLGWSVTSWRETWIGFVSGSGAVVVMLTLPILSQWARFEPAAKPEHPSAAFIFVSLTLLFGAVGEEMLFHGYGFQLLMRSAGIFATLLPTSILFGLAHMGNQGVSYMGIMNTVAWGFLLGWAYWRTRALWLCIGLHFGWNFTLPLFGVNLSGFAMSVTGYKLIWKEGDFWSGGAYGPEGSILTTVMVVCIFLVLRRVIPEAAAD